MIDIVPYLGRNFNKPKSSMFGEQCEKLVSLCTALVAKHLPNSDLYRWLHGMSSVVHTLDDVLNTSIEWLRGLQAGVRTIPHLMTLQGNVFTFKDYLSDVSNWLTHRGDEEEAPHRNSAKLLVYGTPTPFRGNQMTEHGVGNTKLNTLVRNIVLRMRVTMFGSSRLEVTALDCTQGLTVVTLNVSAISGVPSIDQLQLDRSRLCQYNGNCFAHDAVSKTDSKWSPVIMFTRLKRKGPVEEFTVDFYRLTILMVILKPHGGVGSLRELFQSMTMCSVTEY